MQLQGLLLFEDVEADDVDGRDMTDAEGDALLCSAGVPRQFGVFGAALALVESLCCAWAFAKADPEGSLRNSDPNRPLMPFCFF